jgi:hypothetical protein
MCAAIAHVRYTQAMATRMVTVKLDPGEATPAKVAEKLHLSVAQLDPSFGVVELDRDAQLYAVLVDEQIATDLEQQEGVVGSYANPKIEPFGPPKE